MTSTQRSLDVSSRHPTPTRTDWLISTLHSWAWNHGPTPEALTAHPGQVGALANLWATLKFLVSVVTSPIWVPTIAWRAAVNNKRAQHLSDQFPRQIQAIVAGRRPAPPANKVAAVDRPIRMVITSDLHRCIPGRLNWPQRQHTAVLYEHMLRYYAESGWHLCENGDVEDFWIVGGSTYGAAYDTARIGGGILARIGRRSLAVSNYISHLDRIIESNATLYTLLRDEFALAGRYHRTVGNHDDPLSVPEVAQRLETHLPGCNPADYLVLSRNDVVEGVICHGHHTDGWNAPGRANLGKLSAWAANTLIDVPRLDTPEGLPPSAATDYLVNGTASNKLISVNPTFGVTSSYDSMDEEILYEAMRTLGDHHPWLLAGHTHSPVFSPVSRTGESWTRYLNSGSGVTSRCVTAIEWDTLDGEPNPVLVAWYAHDDGRIERIQFVGGKPTLEIAQRDTIATIDTAP